MIGGFAFVLRCAGSAVLAIGLAAAIGLPHSVWAAISAIIVSQNTIVTTRDVVVGRVVGTVVGAVVAVAVGSLSGLVGADSTVQIGVAVAICAAVSWRFPTARVGMWTAPIVLLTAGVGSPLYLVGWDRGVEVILGGLVGAALHMAIGWSVGWIDPEAGG